MSKQSMEPLNLRSAFPEMPEDCRGALLSAARSVREEEPNMRHATVKTLLIAIALLILTTAAALAATEALGWTDFFKSYYDGSAFLPQTAQRVMNREWNKHSFTLGNLTFQTRELYCDGYIAMASTEIKTTDGRKALLTNAPFDAIGANGENGAKLAKQLGVDKSASWIEAAKQLNQPLYCVRAILEMPEEISDGVAMEDVMYSDDGSVTYFSMPELNGKALGETIPCQLYLYAAEINPETGEEENAQRRREEISLFLEAPMETYEHQVLGDFVAGGFSMDQGIVRMELMPAGLYIINHFTALEGTTIEEGYDTLYGIQWLDKDKQPIPDGVNLTIKVNADSWPHVSVMHMLAVDEIPETLVMRMPDTPFQTADTLNPGYQDVLFVKR